jgi:hypothetical protein
MQPIELPDDGLRVNDGGDAVSEYVTQADRDAAQALCASGWTYAIEAFAAHRRSSVSAVEAESGVILKKLRSDVFEILRRHDVSDECFAEVAAVTHAAIVGKEQ